MDHSKKKWLKTILLTILGSIAIEIFFFLFGSCSSNKDMSDSIPWTFHTLWEIAALVLIFYIAKKIKISLQVYFYSLLLGSFLIGLIWIFIPGIMYANYYGIKSRISEETHTEGRYDEQIEYDYPLSLGFLYAKHDPEFTRDFKEYESFNEYVDTEGFLFWQTGLASGYYPYNIPEYNGANTLFDKIELIFTIGPVVLVECTIKGLLTNFPILIIVQVLIILIKKKHILIE